MTTKTERDLALALFGINEALLKGRGVGARTIKVLGNAAVKLTPYVAQPVARGGVGLGRAALAAAPVVGRAALRTATGPFGLALGALTVKEAYDRGLLDAPIDTIQEANRAGLENVERTFVEPVRARATTARRKVSKYSRAVKAGMAAVKRSKFMGKPGTIKNPKQAFARVNKVASTLNRGKKAATTGLVGVIKRGIGKIL